MMKGFLTLPDGKEVYLGYPDEIDTDNPLREELKVMLKSYSVNHPAVAAMAWGVWRIDRLESTINEMLRIVQQESE